MFTGLNTSRFQAREMITERILYDLLALELKQFSKYTLGASPQRLAKTTREDDITIVMPYNVNGNH